MARSRNRRSSRYLGTLTLADLDAAADTTSTVEPGEPTAYPSWTVQRLVQGAPFIICDWADVVTYYDSDTAHALAAELNARAAAGNGLPARVVEVWQ